MKNAFKSKGIFEHTGISRVRTRTVLAVAFTVAISIMAAGISPHSKVMANDSDVRIFTVDVSFFSSYFQNNVDPAETAQDPSAFSQGDTFVQDGAIFPEGTIPDGKTDFDPETPGAIGTYRARGTWTTDLANFLKAAKKDKGADSDLAFATELFSFTHDRSSILTDGTLPNAYFAAHRVVLGGTQNYRDFVGEVHEKNIGENKLGFCNLRVTFKIRRAGDARWR